EYEQKKEYSWKDISEEPLILLETNSTSRNYIDKMFNKQNITLEPQIEIAAHDLLIRFASIHLGVSCVIKEFSKESLEQKIVYEMNLNPPLPPRNIGYAYMKNTQLSLAAKAFLKLINKNVR
ncbi:MAG: LysR family transcriptional regulator substrate-binding protein, partial [Clostridia bacterium]|nr:LysR family transcriptional regulator substrate-binding protein [Clostridia bacterium]